MSSSEGRPQYEYQALAADGNEYSEGNTDLDGSIERASSEYEWSPHPEFESVESEGNPQDTPEELYSAEDKKGKQTRVVRNFKRSVDIHK